MAVAPKRRGQRKRLQPDEMKAMMERAHAVRPLLREFAGEEWKVLLAVVAPEAAAAVLRPLRHAP